MLTEDMQRAINEQINAEHFSGYMYLSMAAYFEGIDLPGFASWMRAQAKEEDMHAMKFFDYVYERGGEVTLMDIKASAKTWKSPLEVFEKAYTHECHVSELINNLLALSRETKDYATENFLQWYVAEQVEEEASADAIVKKLRMIGDAKHGLYMLDKELGARRPE